MKRIIAVIMLSLLIGCSASTSASTDDTETVETRILETHISSRGELLAWVALNGRMERVNIGNAKVATDVTQLTGSLVTLQKVIVSYTGISIRP